MNNKNISKTFSEVEAYLNIIDEEHYNKLPQKLITVINNQKDKNYSPTYDKNKPIDEQITNKDTISIIALLDLNFWCKDEDEKEKLRDIFSKNYMKNENIKREKYSPDNMFKSSELLEEGEYAPVAHNESMIEYKESFFIKIINKIRNIFKK